MTSLAIFVPLGCKSVPLLSSFPPFVNGRHVFKEESTAKTVLEKTGKKRREEKKILIHLVIGVTSRGHFNSDF